MALSLALAGVYGLLAYAGLIVAVVTAIIAAGAFIRGSFSGGGVASAGWFMGVVLSLCCGFAGDWLVAAVAISALPATLALAGVVFVVRAALFRRSPAPAPSETLTLVRH